MPGFFEMGPGFIFVLVLFVYTITSLAGIGVAIRLASVPVINGMKGVVGKNLWRNKSKPILIAFQFAISIFIFIIALTTSQQLDFIQGSDPGFKKSELLVISSVPRNWTSEGVSHMETAINTFGMIPEVSSVSLSYEIPDGNAGNTFSFYPIDGDKDLKVEIPLLKTDEAFRATYGMELNEGKFLNEASGNFSKGDIVINEKAAKTLGWDAVSAIGKRIAWDEDNVFIIKGVIKDFKFSSFYTEIGPVAIIHLKEWNIYRYLTLRFNTFDKQFIDKMENTWKEVFPSTPFDYFFLNDHLDTFYQADQQINEATTLGTAFLIIIIILGSAGLISFSVTRRQKEIAIRKILGASPPSVFWLLFIQFAIPFIFSMVIGILGAYLFLNNWLDNFAYRIDMPWGNFIFPGVILFLIICFTTLLQGARAILSNPVDSIKNE